MVGIESTFAVDAVEGTRLAIVGHEVDAQRYAEAAAPHGAEDG